MGDPKHRQKVLEYFGFEGSGKGSAFNGEKEGRQEDWEFEGLELGEATVFRGLAARLNFMSLDGPDLQVGVKACSREMARPLKGSFKLLKKMARYLIGRQEVV